MLIGGHIIELRSINNQVLASIQGLEIWAVGSSTEEAIQNLQSEYSNIQTLYQESGHFIEEAYVLEKGNKSSRSHKNLQYHDKFPRVSSFWSDISRFTIKLTIILLIFAVGAYYFAFIFKQQLSTLPALVLYKASTLSDEQVSSYTETAKNISEKLEPVAEQFWKLLPYEDVDNE